MLPWLLLGHLALIGAFASIEFLPADEVEAAEATGSPSGEYCRIAREGPTLVRSALAREAVFVDPSPIGPSHPPLAALPASPPLPVHSEHAELLTRRSRAPGRGRLAR